MFSALCWIVLGTVSGAKVAGISIICELFYLVPMQLAGLGVLWLLTFRRLDGGALIIRFVLANRTSLSENEFRQQNGSHFSNEDTLVNPTTSFAELGPVIS